MTNYIKHHGIKGQKWGVRRFQNKDGSLTAKGKKRYNDDEYDEEREALEKENARRAGVKYVRKTKKEREEEDAENERIFNARLEKDTAAQKRTEDRMKEIDKKLQAKYDLSSMDDLDKYYKEYDEAWFEVLAEERKKEGLAHADLFTLDELYHHGIKGMKWGIRRFQNKDGTLTPAGRKRQKQDEGPIHEDYSKSHNAKSVKSMSDKELRDRLNRLNMERQYAQLTAPQQNLGKKIVGEVLLNVGKELAKEYLKNYAKKGIEEALKKNKK